MSGGPRDGAAETASELWRPGRLRPMLAQRVDEPFDSPEHLFEIKWDGYRCIAFAAGRVVLQSRTGRDMTPLFPELAAPPDPSAGPAILDGEIVAWRDGRPDFAALQQRARLREARAIAAQAGAQPVTLVVFDLLHAGGRDLIGLPCEERRRRLRRWLEAAGWPPDRFTFSEAVEEKGRELFTAVARAGLEGVMAKRRHSPYRPGQRSWDWLKVPLEHRLNCVIGGVTPGGHYGIGALLLGAYDGERPERLTFLGHVGAGIGHDALSELVGRLRAVAECPFHAVPRSYRTATWVAPETVCQVGYRELTRERRLRHPVYRGLMEGVDPRSCRVPWDRSGDPGQVGSPAQVGSQRQVGSQGTGSRPGLSGAPWDGRPVTAGGEEAPDGRR